tara:strand:+ start:194 stop:2008 length:1815 start_codon:yes stop_codon:yes gene_type:complete
MTLIHLRGLSHNYHILLKDEQKEKSKMPPQVIDLLKFSEEGRNVLAKNEPLPGFKTSVQDSINDAVSQSSSSVQKGHDYLVWVLTNIFEETKENAENAIIDGSNDCGIDAVLRYDKEILLVQSKFGESHNIGMIDKFVKDVERFKNTEQSSVKRNDLSYLWNEINQKGVEVKLVYITNQEAEYQSDVVKVIDFAETCRRLSQRKMKPEKGHKVTMNYLDGFSIDSIFQCYMDGAEVAKLVERNRWIIDNNLRHHLGHRVKVNKGIKQTLEECPERFAEYNNGLTVTAVENEIDESKKQITLDSPVIVNGAQTSHQVLDRSKKTKNMIAKIPVKIVKTRDEEHQKNITRFSNTQNAVKGKDLVSLEDFWKSISYQMETRVGYFFEYQTGSWDSGLDAGEKSKFSGDDIFNQYLPVSHKKKLTAKDAIQTYVSYFKQNPTGAYQSISKFLPGGAEYDKIFTEEMIEDYRTFLYPTLIMECAKNEFEYGPKNKVHPFKRYSTVFFVAVTGKIIHEHILETLDDFDNDIDKLENIIKDVNLFKRILKLTDNIVTQVLASSNLDDELKKVNNSPHNLFASGIWNESMRKVIEHFIQWNQNEINEIKNLI